MNKDLKIDHSSLQEVWAWDDEKSCGIKCKLVEFTTDNTVYKYRVAGTTRGHCFKNCEPYDNQDEQQTRPMMHHEVFNAISNGAVVRFVYEDGALSHITNVWQTGGKINRHVICYNYTGAESDKWEKMEVAV